MIMSDLPWHSVDADEYSLAGRCHRFRCGLVPDLGHRGTVDRIRPGRQVARHPHSVDFNSSR
jgi:hypothetical protein